MGTISSEGVVQELQVLDPSNRAISFELQGTVYVPIHDVFGHIRALLDNSGNCVATYRYSAFGEEQIQGDVLSPWRYSGKRIDAETGLIYFGKRYYDPKTLCWLTPDPIGDRDGPNYYAYVHNNPLYYTDPDGRLAFLLALVPVLEVVTVTWGSSAGVVISCITMETLGYSILLGAAGYVLDETVLKIDQVANNENSEAKDDDKFKKYRDPNYPGSAEDLENHPEWIETSHPNQKDKGHREFTNGKTGEKIRYDQAKPGATGHKGRDHHHRYNPNSTRQDDKYLDPNGNPVGKNDDASHLYPPRNIS